jgi:hypothetical protein
MNRTWKLVVAAAVMAAVLVPLAALAQEKVVVEERTITILKKVGNTVVVRNDKGEVRKFMNLPPGVSITVDGKPAQIKDLREGMRLKAVRLADVPASSVVTVTMEEVQAMPPSDEPAVAPETPIAAAPAPEPAAAPAPPAELPPTAGVLPLLALLGAGLAGTGFALGRARR